MAAHRPAERRAHRPRWRPVPNPRGSPPSKSRTTLAPNRQAQRQGRALPPGSKPDRSTSIMTQASFPGPASSATSPGREVPQHRPRSGHQTHPAVTATDLAMLDLPQLFNPLQAAEILRHLGLTEMTECALRTRAYRRQVPFHLNGRRIRFTTGDLREIAEGQARRPRPPDSPSARSSTRRPPASRRSPSQAAEQAPVAWRARNSRDKPAGKR